MLSIAKVLKSNGTDGGLLVSAPEFELEEIQGPVFIDFDGLPAPFFIEDCTRRGTCRYVIHLTDIESLKDAEEIVGKELLLDGEDEGSDEGDGFIGWTVFDGEHRLGNVVDCEPIPGNFCLYVDKDGEELMIPLHEDFVIKMDEESETLILRLPEGLY